jgi:hypothetical protein
MHESLSTRSSRPMLAVLSLAALCAGAVLAQQATPKAPAVAENYGKLPLSFEANQGQTDPQVQFLSKGNGYTLFLTNKAAVLALTRTEPCSTNSPNKPVIPTEAQHSGRTCASTKTDVVRMELTGANPTTQVEGTNHLPGIANYFIGNDPSKWHTSVPTYSKVSYKNVYPGVDLLYYGNQRQLEYDFVVAPHASAKEIKLHFAGATKLNLNQNGDLEVVAANGEVAFHKPLLYQIKQGQLQPVEGTYTLLARNEVGFKIGTYDQSRNLIIDPTLAYSTYLGGTGGDIANGVAVDTSGNTYVTGTTSSTDFPTMDPYQEGNGNKGNNCYTHACNNVFVTKLNATGSALIYSTYLGGLGGRFGDSGAGIAINDGGEAYVAGYTGSDNFPITPDAFQQTNYSVANTPAENASRNAFITKLSADGSKLVYSTYLGGTGDSGLSDGGPGTGGDYATGIALDPAGDAVVTGTAFSYQFPNTTPTYQDYNKAEAIRSSNAFIAKLNGDGTGLIYFTFLGGTGLYDPNGGEVGGDFANSIAVDGKGDAYVAGYTYSTDFPVYGKPNVLQQTNNAGQPTSPYKGTQSAANAFVAELNPTGSELVYSTYLGGSGYFNPYATGYVTDAAYGIAVDSSCSAYVAGRAVSPDFRVTVGKFLREGGFVAKLNPTGSALSYSTIVGGTKGGDDGDIAFGVAVNESGNTYVIGKAESTNLPTTSVAFQAGNDTQATNGSNAFVAQLSPDGTAIDYSSYLGGKGIDIAWGIAVDSSGNAYIAGQTTSENFPLSPNGTAYQKVNKEYAADNTSFPSAFVAKFGIGTGQVLTETKASITADANPAAEDELVTFTADIAQNTACGFPPTGTATFTIDGGTPIPVKLDDTGHAIYQTATLVTGTHTIDVSYSGDSKYSASTATPYKETITTPPATLAVAAGSGQSSIYGTPYKTPLTVLVKDAKGNPSPGVVVTFTATGLKFSSTTAITASNGEASVTATPTAVGALTATASAENVKATVTFPLTATPAVLTVTASNVSVTYGQPIPALTYALTGFVNGDSKTVVTGAPAETTIAKQGSPVGTYPIAITAGTLKATNYTFKFIDGTVTITSLGTTATPTFSPVGGTYSGTQMVAIADATSGATIYFTLNGATPSTSTSKYTKPIKVGVTQTIKALAVTPGYTNSAIAAATYTIK